MVGKYSYTQHMAGANWGLHRLPVLSRLQLVATGGGRWLRHQDVTHVTSANSGGGGTDVGLRRPGTECVTCPIWWRKGLFVICVNTALVT